MISVPIRIDVVAPEIADAEEARRLENEEQAARERCRLTLTPNGEGSTRVSGLIPDADATRLRTPTSKPSPAPASRPA
jgi:hypothetical protein